MSDRHSEIYLVLKLTFFIILLKLYGLLCGTMLTAGIVLAWLTVVWGVLGYKPLLATEIVYFSVRKRSINIMGCMNVQGTKVDDILPLLKKLPYFPSNIHMQCKVVNILGEHYWSPPIKKLNLDEHIHVVKRDLRSYQEIAALAAQKIEEPLPFDRPLWEITVVDSFNNSELVLYFKFHHSLSDGLSSVNCVIGNLADDYKGLLHKLPVIPWYKKLFTALLIPVFIVYIVLRLLFLRKDYNIFTGRVPRENTAVLCDSIELTKLKAASKRLNVTINDLLASAVLTGIKRYMERYDSAESHGGELIKVGMPMIMKENTNGLRSMQLDPKLSLIYVDLPLPSEGAPMTPSFINCVKSAIMKLKGSIEPLAVYYMGVISTPFVPSLLLNYLVIYLADQISFLFTNMAGCPEPLHVAGRKVTSMYCFAPNYSDIPFAVAVASYAGEVRISCISNQVKVEDQSYMMAQMYAAANSVC